MNPHFSIYINPVGRGCRIHQTASLQRGKIPNNESPGYNTNQSDREVPVMVELWGMWVYPFIALRPFPLWLEVVAPMFK